MGLKIERLSDKFSPDSVKTAFYCVSRRTFSASFVGKSKTLEMSLSLEQNKLGLLTKTFSQVCQKCILRVRGTFHRKKSFRKI